MNLATLRKEIERDEGIKYEIYYDHLGYPTFGIGHFVKTDDPEFGQPIGFQVSEERVHEAFESDMETVLKDCTKLYSDWDELPEEAQHIIANMMFNMGYPRLSKFKNMKAAVDARDWQQAAIEMKSSLWYKQVTNRAQRLVDRMGAIS